jgi:hypothetical protein
MQRRVSSAGSAVDRITPSLRVGETQKHLDRIFGGERAKAAVVAFPFPPR